MYVYVLALYSSVVCMSVCVEVLSMNSFLLLIACVIIPEHCVHTLTGYHPFFQFNTLSLLLFCLHLHVALDYAHESVGFLTWHRIYLLWFEREMQILLGDNQFTVRYWDWTIPGNRNALFVSNKLGVSDDNGKVTGDLLSSWYLVCVDANGTAVRDTVCDPTTTPGNNSVVRCGVNAHCNSLHWPDEANVKRAINDFEQYRTTANPNIANKYDMMSFSNYFEGFGVDDECDVHEGDKPLLCGSDPVIRRRLHNLVSWCESY